MVSQLGDLEPIRREVEELRKIGTKSAVRAAERLEQRLYLLETMSPQERMSSENVREWWDTVYAEVPDNQKGNPDAWEEHTRDELFEILQTVTAANQFRMLATAKYLDVSRPRLASWLKSASYQKWFREKGRRSERVAAVADLALSRAAEILSMKSMDPGFIAMQARLATSILTIQAQVAIRNPTGGGGGDSPGAVPPPLQPAPAVAPPHIGVKSPLTRAVPKLATSALEPDDVHRG